MNGRVLTGLMMFALGIATMFVGVLLPQGWEGNGVMSVGFALGLLSAANAGMQWRN